MQNNSSLALILLLSASLILLCAVLPALTGSPSSLRLSTRPSPLSGAFSLPAVLAPGGDASALVAALQSGSPYLWEGHAEDAAAVAALLPAAARALEFEGVAGECVGVRARAAPYLIDPTLALAPTLASGLSSLSTVPEHVRLRWSDKVALFHVVPRKAPRSPIEYQTALPAVFLSPLTFAAFTGHGTLYSRSGAWAAFTPRMEHADLVRSMVSQAVCSLAGARVGYFAAPSAQNFTAHGGFSDVSAAALALARGLRGWALRISGQCVSLAAGDLLVSAYEELFNGGMVLASTVTEARAWVLQLKAAGYAFPPPPPCASLDEGAVLSPPLFKPLPIHAAVYVSMVSSNIAPWAALYGSSFESFSFYQELHPEQLLNGHLPPPVYPGHELALESPGVAQWSLAYRAFIKAWDALHKNSFDQMPAGLLYAHDDMHLDLSALAAFMSDPTKCVIKNYDTNCPPEGLPDTLCDGDAQVAREDLALPGISRICFASKKAMDNTSWWVGGADWILVKTGSSCAEATALFVDHLRAFESKLRNLERVVATALHCAYGSSQISVGTHCTAYGADRPNPAVYIKAILGDSPCTAVHPLKIQHSAFGCHFCAGFFSTCCRRHS